jgi:ribosomal RNA assembly protein
METIYSENTRKILQNKKVLEDSFKIKISIKENIVELTGKAPDEYLALQAIEAINLGFAISDVTNLKYDDYMLEKIQIKSISKRKDLSQVRGRIIGEQRKVLRTIEDLTGCSLVVHDNWVGIIGLSEQVRKTAYAIKKLIAGSKHANVYSYLEEERAKERESL